VNHISRQRITSAGLALGVLSSLIAIMAAGRAMVSGPGKVAGVHLTISLPSNTIVVFVVSALILAGLLMLTGTWAKLVGVAVVFGLAGTEALMVTIAKTSTRFHSGAATHLESGGQILGVAFVVAMVGVVVMIVGARELVPQPDPSAQAVDPANLPVRAGNASVAFGFSALGVVFSPAAPVGVMLGLIAFGQITQSRDRIPGRNVALAAAIVGTAWITLWTLLVFATGIYAAHSI
jgi:hypothetical protein